MSNTDIDQIPDFDIMSKSHKSDESVTQTDSVEQEQDIKHNKNIVDFAFSFMELSELKIIKNTDRHRSTSIMQFRTLFYVMALLSESEKINQLAVKYTKEVFKMAYNTVKALQDDNLDKFTESRENLVKFEVYTDSRKNNKQQDVISLIRFPYTIRNLIKGSVYDSFSWAVTQFNTFVYEKSLGSKLISDTITLSEGGQGLTIKPNKVMKKESKAYKQYAKELLDKGYNSVEDFSFLW